MLALLRRKKLVGIEKQKLVRKSPWPKVISMFAIFVGLVWLFRSVDPNFENSHLLSKLLGGFLDFSPVEIGAGTSFNVYNTLFDSIRLLMDTLVFSLLGTTLGIMFSIPIAFVSSKNIVKKWYIYSPIRWMMSIIRSIPPLVYAFLIFNVFTPGLAATISLAIFVCAIMVKWLYEELDTIDLGAYDSMVSYGNTRPRAIMKAIMPILMKKVVSYGLYAFEMVLRFATILSVVGIPTIGLLMTDRYKDPSNWGHLLIVLGVLITAIIIIESITIIVKRYVLNPTLKQATLDKNAKFDDQVIALNKQKSKVWIMQLIFVVLLFASIIYAIANVEFGFANDVRLEYFKSGMKKLFSPDWSLITEFGTGINAVELAFETLWIAIASAIIGALLGMVFGILASSNITGKVFSWLPKIFIISVRAVPTFVYAIVFVQLIAHHSPWAAVMAMGIRSVGMLGKLTYEKIESTDMGGKLSMDVAGNTNFNSTRIAIISEALPNIIANGLYRVEINFKSIVEVGAVGASVFGIQLLFYSGDPNNYDKLTPYVLIMILFVLTIEQVSTLIRKKIMTGYFINADSKLKKLIRSKQHRQSLIRAVAFNYKYANSSMARRYDALQDSLRVDNMRKRIIVLDNLLSKDKISDMDVKKFTEEKEQLLKNIKSHKLIIQKAKEKLNIEYINIYDKLDKDFSRKLTTTSNNIEKGLKKTKGVKTEDIKILEKIYSQMIKSRKKTVKSEAKRMLYKKFA